VALVVAKLLNIVRPSRSYFGQKDYQQTRVIRSVVRELDLPGDVVICPTVREPDGLAMSSRNRYLSGPERQQALALRRALLAAEAMLAAGERAAEKVSEAMRAILASAPDLAVEYAQVCDAGTLQELTVLQDRVLLAVAARIGGTRLIDNSLVPLGRAPLGHTRLSGEKEF
jgi:pantoate--beta-alanine ligase